MTEEIIHTPCDKRIEGCTCEDARVTLCDHPQEDWREEFDELFPSPSYEDLKRTIKTLEEQGIKFPEMMARDVVLMNQEKQRNEKTKHFIESLLKREYKRGHEDGAGSSVTEEDIRIVEEIRQLGEDKMKEMLKREREKAIEELKLEALSLHPDDFSIVMKFLKPKSDIVRFTNDVQ